MKSFLFETQQFLPVSIDRAWDFFSSAKNLTMITPSELDFKIVTPLNDKEIYEGMIIDYKVRPLFGISVRWQTEICKVEKPCFFTDRQLTGPYKVWEHTHMFKQKKDGVLMIDEVKYALPFGIIGSLAHLLLVRKKIEKIFDYRKQVLYKIFIKNEHCVN